LDPSPNREGSRHAPRSASGRSPARRASPHTDWPVFCPSPGRRRWGVAEVVAPFDYNNGLITWRPYTGGNISVVNDAYSSYLRMFHTAEYEASCSPAAYTPGTVIQDRGPALTGECAQLAAPLAADVVRWISDGRPDDQQ